MKISVIIPTYKPQDYLWECLGSIVSQSFSKADFEVIIVLNGCGEPYKGEIEQYISAKMKGMNVNFIHTETGGVSNARNIALDNAKGEFVTFIDDDDYVSPNYLKELYSKADNNTISLSYPYAFIDGNPKQIPYRITKVYDDLNKYGCQNYIKARKYFSGPCMKLIPMNFIQKRRFDVKFKNEEDSLFMFLISDKMSNVIFTTKDAVYYRRYRNCSAVNRQQTIKDLMSGCLKTMLEYTKIYFSGKYNFYFYILRIAATIHYFLSKIFNKTV